MDWGTIDTLPEIPGLALYKDGHAGYYIGLPIPDKLKAVLEQLHNRDEKEGKDDQGDGE